MTAPLVSRGPMGLIAAVLAGGLSVAFLVTALLHEDTLLIFLAYFAALPLYLAGLGAGALAGLIAPITGTLMLYAMQPPNIAVLYVFAFAVPAIIISTLALRYRLGENEKVFWYPEGHILTAITLYPCVLFLAADIAVAGHPGGLLDITQHAISDLGKQLAKTFTGDQAELFYAAIANAAKIAPALIAYTWIFVAIISLAGAQNILRRHKLNLRDHFSLQALHVPLQLIYGVAATGLFGVFAPAPYDYIGRNLSLILGLPFFFAGLAVIHVWVAGFKHPAFFLSAFYMLLFFLPWMALIIVALGVVDQWVDFRQRIARNTTV